MKLESVLCRLFQVVPCLLQIISGRFWPTVGRFLLFLFFSRLFQVVSGCFWLVVSRLKSFLARCRSFQVVSCLLQVVFSKYEIMIYHDCPCKCTDTQHQFLSIFSCNVQLLVTIVIKYSKILMNLILKLGKSLALGLCDITSGKLPRQCTF